MNNIGLFLTVEKNQNFSRQPFWNNISNLHHEKMK